MQGTTTPFIVKTALVIRAFASCTAVQHPIPHSARRIVALLLLYAFVLGGIVAPSIHLVHHGLLVDTHAELGCDHHELAWHPDFELLHEGDCLLCQRDVIAFNNPPELAIHWPPVSRILLGSTLAPDDAAYNSYLIRAPPTESVAFPHSDPFMPAAGFMAHMS